MTRLWSCGMQPVPDCLPQASSLQVGAEHGSLLRAHVYSHESHITWGTSTVTWNLDSFAPKFHIFPWEAATLYLPTPHH
jgi:hypothetical protein